MKNHSDKTLWILSELYHPEDTGSGYYITKIAEAIAAKHRVRVLTVQPTYGARGKKAPADEVVNLVSIHRCPATTLNKDILPFRLLNLMTISVSVLFNALLRVKKGDIVLVITNPPTLPFIAMIACRFSGAKLVLRVEDLYPEVLVAAGIVKPDSAIAKGLKAVHIWLYQHTDHILVLGREMMRIVQSRNGSDKDHVALVTHWADNDQVVPLPRDGNALLIKLDLMDKFVVQYSGNMGRTHDVESLVQCAEILEKHQDIHFLFIGSGAKEPWLKKRVLGAGLKNVTILPPRPRKELTVSLNACDLAVISFVKGMAGVSVPSRMYNIMSSGKPILAVADRESELSRVVAEENIGWIVEPESPPLIANAILQAKANRAMREQMAAKARLAAVEKYAFPVIVKQYRDLMDSCHA